MKISRSNSSVPTFAYWLAGLGVYFFTVGLVGMTMLGIAISGESWSQLDLLSKSIIFLGSVGMVVLMIAEIIFWCKYFFVKQSVTTEPILARTILGVIVIVSLVYLIEISMEILVEGLTMPFR